MKQLFYKGKPLLEACKEKGISRYTVRGRIYERKIPLEKAIETPPGHFKVKYWYNGRPAKEVCKEKGISYSTFSKRITSYGMSVEQAIEAAIEPPFGVAKQRQRMLKGRKE